MLLRVVETSITVGIIIVALILFFNILSKRFSTKWRYWIWILLCLRLILPFNINFSKPLVIFTPPVSIQNSVTNLHSIRTNENIIPNTEKNFNIPEQKSAFEDNVINEKGFNILYVIWILGTIILLTYRFLRYFIFRKTLLRWTISSQGELIEKILQELREELQLKSKFTLLIAERAPSPMVLGFLKPLLILPNQLYRKQDLKIILKHELIHIKRRDIWYKLLMSIAVALHWFNPLVYLMESSANRDLELSCDEELIKGKDIEYRRLYSQAILRAIEFKKVCNCTFTTNWGGKKIMKQRFENILNRNKKSNGILTAIAILIIVIFSSSLVACSNNQPSSSKQGNSINSSNKADENTKTNSSYKTESDFLNSPEGVKFQQVAYKSAKAYLSGNLKQVSEYFLEPKTAFLQTENIFSNLEYIILKWSLADIKSENEIIASYEYKINGEDSVSYITMELQKVDNTWKVKSIAVEK